MAFNLFGKKKNAALKKFVAAVKNGERDFFSLLGTRPERFREASFEEIMSNEDDVLAHINRVQVNTNDRFFDLFDVCLVKHNDAGDIEYIFVTTTSDATRIIEMSDVMFEELGIGIYDNYQFSSFREHDKIWSLAKGNYNEPTDAPMHIWSHENISFCLYYRITPLRQFTFSISVKAPEVADTSVRKKGTILDMLRFNPETLLQDEPVHQQEEYSGGTIKFIDYTYALEPKEWGLFNAIELRIFSDKRAFNKFVQTHVTLFTAGPADPDLKIKVVEDLYRIYGIDNGNSGELEFYERRKIEEGTFWIGRTWRFNQAHAPLNLDSKEETMTYEVRVDNMEYTDSFKVHIFSYNELVSLFALD
ncbi:MAG: hypothetical protein JNM88_11755 [Chitinophagaceae bacterium]|nr:hypothetical protein [Chitinophagaceae bacterium]